MTEIAMMIADDLRRVNSHRMPKGTPMTVAPRTAAASANSNVAGSRETDEKSAYRQSGTQREHHRNRRAVTLSYECKILFVQRPI